MYWHWLHLAQSFFTSMTGFVYTVKYFTEFMGYQVCSSWPLLTSTIFMASVKKKNSVRWYAVCFLCCPHILYIKGTREQTWAKSLRPFSSSYTGSNKTFIAHLKEVILSNYTKHCWSSLKTLISIVTHRRREEEEKWDIMECVTCGYSSRAIFQNRAIERQRCLNKIFYI